jgi:hypothetical protein
VNQPHVLNLRSALLAATTALVIASSTVAPSLAYQSFPTAHLVDNNLNPKAMVAGGEPFSDLGDLQAGQYAVVTASGIINGGETTVSFTSNDGQGSALTVSRVLANGVPTLVNFGKVANPDGSGELVASWYAGDQQTNVSLDIWSPNL